MDAYFKKKLLYVASFFITAVVLEVLTFVFIGLGAFPEYFWLGLIFLFMISCFIFIIPSFKAQAILIVVILVIQALLSYLNHSLYVYQLGMIFQLKKLTAAGAAGMAFTGDYISLPVLAVFLLVLTFEILFLVRLRKIKTQHTFKKSISVSILVIFCFVQFLGSILYSVSFNSFNSVSKSDDDYYRLNDKYLYDTLYNPQSAFQKFGTYVFYMRDIYNFLNNESSTELVDSYYSTKDMSKDSLQHGVYQDNNVIVIMLESFEWYAINERFTPTLYALSQSAVSMRSYTSKNKTNHSEAIGILGSYPFDYNINGNVTEDANNRKADTNANISYPFALPNVLKQGGYVTSYMHNNEASFYDRVAYMNGFGFDNAYFLEDLDGITRSAELKTEFYDFALDSEMFANNLDKIIPDTDSPFYTMITTLVTHGNYNCLVDHGDYTSDLSDAEKAKRSQAYTVKGLEPYYEKISRSDFEELFDMEMVRANYPHNEQAFNELYLRYKRYQAAAMDLDKGIDSLITALDEQGKLEETTIILYSDHCCYYHDLMAYLKTNFTTKFDPRLYVVPFIIYDGTMDLSYVNQAGEEKNFISESAEKFNKSIANMNRSVCTYDIVPTVLDLLGINYDVKLYQGQSMFVEDSTPSTVFVSLEAGYLDSEIYTFFDELYYHDDEIFYYSNEKKLYEYDRISQEKGKDVSDSEMKGQIIEFNKRVNRFLDKQIMLEMVYESRYFLDKGISGFVQYPA